MKVETLVIKNNNIWITFEEILSKNSDITKIVIFAIASLFQTNINFLERVNDVHILDT